MTRVRSSAAKLFCLALIWLSVWLGWPIRPALATPIAHHERCTCSANADSLPAAVAHADAVFVGEVTSLNDPSQSAVLLLAARFNTRLYQPMFTARQVSLDVSQSWAGVQTRRVQLWTKPAGGECGYPFAAGERYLVYAQRVDDRWTTDACARTRPVVWAASDLAYLSTLPVLPLRSNLTWAWIGLVVAGLITLSALGGYFRFVHKPTRLPNL